MAKAIELIETRRGCAMLERECRYDVMLHGKLFGQLSYNTGGHVGYLPAPHPLRPGPISLNIGERPIGAYRKEVARLNREWALFKAPPLPACAATHCHGCVNCGRGHRNR